MENVVLQLIAEWGLLGLIIAWAIYIVIDNWKKNKKNEEWYREAILREQHAIGSREEISKSLDSLREEIQQILEKYNQFRSEMSNRIEKIEKAIVKHHPSSHQYEVMRMTAVAKIAPAINTILLSTLDDCKLDHIALALLHNGTSSVAGIPYIKVGVIAEKFKPVEYPGDTELTIDYKDEDIIKYNKLPACIIQSGYLEFDIDNNLNLDEIDYGTYSKCKNKGIKHIAFIAINDSYGLCTGCVIAYNFTDTPINKDDLLDRVKVIENLYQTMLKSFED